MNRSRIYGVLLTVLVASILTTSSFSLAKPWPSIELPTVSGEVPFGVTKAWTFILYHDADNNLGTYAYDDLVEMMGVGSDNNVNVVVLYDTFGGPACAYFIPQYSGSGPMGGIPLDESTVGAARAYPMYGEEVNMGSAETLGDFLDYVYANFKSDYYLLDIWDHGDDFRGACKDYNTGVAGEVGFLYHRDAVPVIGSHQVDILAFDACIEGMVEVAYDYKDVAKYLIGSEDYVPYHGFPYDALLSKLEAKPEQGPAEYSKAIVNEYMSEYLKPNGNGGGGYVEAFPTISAIDLTQVNDFVEKLNDFTGLLSSDMKGYGGLIASSRAKSILNMPIYGWDADIDLYTFVSRVGERAGGEVGLRAGEVLAYWNVAQGFIYSGRSHQYETKSAQGLGVFFPSSAGSVVHNSMTSADYYFSREEGGDYTVPFAGTGWGDMIRTFLGLPS